MQHRLTAGQPPLQLPGPLAAAGALLPPPRAHRSAASCRPPALAMASAPVAASALQSVLLQQVIRPASCALLTHLRTFSAAATAAAPTAAPPAPTDCGAQSSRVQSSSGAPPPAKQRRFLRTTAWGPFGSGRHAGSAMESNNSTNMADAVTAKPPSPRHPEAVMASAFNSPKRSGLSTSAPPPAALQLPPLSLAGGAAPRRGMATSAVARPPLDLDSQPSMTDLVNVGANGGAAGGADSEDSDIVLDPNTPRSPKHQQAEQIMTTGKTAQVLKRHMDAVVKVFATHSKPNWTLPWQRQQQYTSKSTGFAVKTPQGERWLLTNAHSVTYGTQVQLKKRGDDEKYPAKVLAVGTECDVALLTVEDELFWKDIVPLDLGDLPKLQESVAVLGYPIGGDSLAVSAGVVSRVSMTHYSHGCMSLLAVQTDAAINSGNSGGPVMNAKGQCVGIAFQSLTGDTQSVGYVIPTSVVRHFLDDYVKHGKYTGFPSLNVVWQEIESRALKKAYNMQPHQKGVLVRSVNTNSCEAGVLQPDDIILRIDGTDLGNDGTVPFRQGERVDFKYLITGKHVGDTVTLDILRGGKEQSVQVTLSQYQYLIPPHLREAKPSYFIVGGLVFTSCSDPYLVQRYGSLGGAPVRLMARTYYGVKTQSDEQVVILSSVLACEANMGYESTLGVRDAVIKTFNGQPVHSLAQLARLVGESQEEYFRFDLEAASKVVVVDAKTARCCTKTILDEFNISTEMSKDVREQLDAWEAEKKKEGKQGGKSEGGAAQVADGAEQPEVMVTPAKRP